MRDKFLSAMGNIDEKYVAEFEKAKKARKRAFITRMAAIAACLCIVAGGVAAAFPLIVNNGEGTLSLQAESTAPAPTAPAPTEPQPQEPDGPFRMVNVTAEKMKGEFVAADSDFIVEAENATADIVREHVYISGGPEYTVTDMGGGKYRVSLQGSLSSGDVVSLSYANDGVTEYSWAFETERKLEVSSSLPRNGAQSVDVTSVIRLELSMNTDTTLADYAAFTPEIEGTWEQLGKIHQFIPSSPLATDTLYTLTVKAGVAAGEHLMEEDYVISFDTGRASAAAVLSPYLKDVYNFTPAESPVVRYKANGNTAHRVSVSRFAGYEDMIAYSYGNAGITTTDEAEVTFTEMDLADNERDLILPSLAEGYYLVRAYSAGGTLPFLRAVVQINDVRAYLAVTNDDVLVWCDREGVRAQYGDVTALTDESGIAILEDAGNSGSAAYVTLSDGEDTQIALVPDFDTPAPDGYIYCDKPIYKSTDTVSFFGAVPLPLFADAATGKFTVELVLSGKTVLTVPVTTDENGTFTGELSFSDFTGHTSARLRLCYNGSVIGSRWIEIENYYLENYTYTVEPVTDNLIEEGESYTFGVKVVHISGVPVQGKELRAQVEFSEEIYYATTDTNGVATFSVPFRPTATGPDYGKNTQYETVTLRISSADGADVLEYSDYMTSTYFCNVNTQYAFTTDCGKDTFRAVAVRIKSDVDAILTGYYPEEDDGVLEKDLEFTGTVYLNLYHSGRKKTGVSVDESSGRTHGIYDRYHEECIYSETLTIDKTRLFELDLSPYELPEADELNRYYYTLSYVLYTADGGISESYYYRPKSNEYTDPYAEQNQYSGMGGYTGALSFDSYYNAETYGYNLADEEYHTYRYTYDIPYEVGLGETVEITVHDSMAKKKVEEGTFLRIIYRDGVIRADIVEADELSFGYTEELGPFFKVTLAYLRDGRFYRTHESTVRRKAEERTLTVTAATDKEFYEPGGEATVTVTVTDHTGAPVSGTVNVSVVNEALLKSNYHPTDIMGNVDSSIHGYRLFTYSSFFDSELNAFLGGYGGGGGEDVRVDFADTACFRTLTTDENGVAKVTFTLPDNITEYRITAHAATADMCYGVGQSPLVTRMDFFLQSTAREGLKSTDDFVPTVNSVSNVGYGTVNYTFLIKETGQSIDAYAFTGAGTSVNFGKLEVGTYTLRIDATLYVDGTAQVYTDAMEYPFTVVAGAMQDAYTDSLQSGDTVTVTPASYPVKVELYTREAEFYRTLFDYASSLASTRADCAISRYALDRLYNTLTLGEPRLMNVTVSDGYKDKDGLISLYKGGGVDYVVSAMTSHFLPGLINGGYTGAPRGEYNYVLWLMLRASEGRAVLNELKAAEEYARGDDTLTAVIGASYAMLGDYDGAKRMYADLPERSEENGADALRAFIATFVDRDNAGVLLYSLITEEPEERYLGFAIVSYMTRRIMSVTEERRVTLTVNGVSEEYTVSGLTPVTLLYTRTDTPDLTVSIDGAGVCASVTYRSTERVNSGGDYYMWIEGDLRRNTVAYLVFNADTFRGDVTLDVALPPSMCLLSRGALPQGVWSYVRGYNLRIGIDEAVTGTVRIPLMLSTDGNYLIEPIRLTTEAGNRYYSNRITVDIE